MKVFMVLAAMTVTTQLYAADLAETCAAMECAVGDKAITFSSKSDFYFACPSNELSEYTNTVVGLAAMAIQISGKAPNISPSTGEPQFDGTTKEMLDTLRANASVNTYDEAIAKCTKGGNKLPVLVMNNPQDSSSIWVSDVKQKTFWMPKAYLTKR